MFASPVTSHHMALAGTLFTFQARKGHVKCAKNSLLATIAGVIGEAMQPMMACGHQAHGVQTFLDGREPIPACVICDPPDNTKVIGFPDLSGRQAKCYCGALRDSSDALEGRLAFFEYLGPGSRDSEDKCKHCPYARIAHDYFPYYYPGRCPSCNENALKYLGGIGSMWGCQHCKNAFTNSELPRPPVKNPQYKAHTFAPHGPYEHDRYYCGHAGWD